MTYKCVNCIGTEDDHEKKGMRMRKRFVIILCLFLLPVLGMPAGGMAEEGVQNQGWQFGGNLYLWMATIGGKTPSGDTLKMDFDDIAKDLEFAIMGGADARNGRWHLTTDVIYMKLKQDNNGKVTVPDGRGLTADTTVEMRSWVVTPAIGYAIINTDRFVMEVMGGAQYLWIKPQLILHTSDQVAQRDIRISDSADVWDGIVGIRGILNMNQNWYLQYLVDIGTGDSTFTWQSLTGIGYKVSSVVDVVAAWRYLYWNFEDNKALDSLYIKGPVIGAKVRF